MMIHRLLLLLVLCVAFVNAVINRPLAAIVANVVVGNTKLE